MLPGAREKEQRIFIFPNSALKQNEKKINYAQFLAATENKACIEALKRIAPKIDLNKIKIYMIDDINIPVLSEYTYVEPAQSLYFASCFDKCENHIRIANASG